MADVELSTLGAVVVTAVEGEGKGLLTTAQKTDVETLIAESGYSETIVFEQDYGTTSGAANTSGFSIDEYDEIRVTGNNTNVASLVLELSTDDGSSWVTTSGYYENWVQGSNDGGGTVDHIDLSGSGSGRWRCDLQSHNFDTHPTRALLYYGNGSNFFEIGETRTFANAAHNRARVNFSGTMTNGFVQIIGIKYGAGVGGGGGGGGGGASALGDLSDVTTTGPVGDVLTKQSDGTFALETPAVSNGIATHSTGDFGVGTASPDKQLHVLTDPGAASILPGTVPDSGGILIEANGLGAGATGSFPGITMCSVDAGCTHIHSINASGHWVHESEINFPTKEWRVRLDDETDGSRPAQRMSMDPTGRLMIDDLTNDSSTLAPYEGRLKARGLQNGASPTVSVFNIRQDYNAAGRNPAISIGMDQTFDVNQLLIEAHYQNNWSSDVHFYTRDTTSGEDGLNAPYSNMNETITLKGEGQLVGVSGVTDPATELHVGGAITLNEKSADPANPAEGRTVIWMSDGTGAGDDGDVMVKITAGGTTKTVTLIDFSAA